MERKTEPKMIKFPSIDSARLVLPKIIRAAQFTHVDPQTKKACYDTTAALPVLEFRGTVKLHGSNAAIVKTMPCGAVPGAGASTETRTGTETTAGTTTAGGIHFQSRERTLLLSSDLMGFHAAMSAQLADIEYIFEGISRSLLESSTTAGLDTIQGEKKKNGGPCGKKKNGKAEMIDTIALFGEWCGSNIQKGVALTHLPKMFVIFAIKITYRTAAAAATDTAPSALVPAASSEWLDLSVLSPAIITQQVTQHSPTARIFTITSFPTFNLVIDFRLPTSLAAAQKTMDDLTATVERECPVGKHFGVAGKGEGIVWQAVAVRTGVHLRGGGAYVGSSSFWFKTKGMGVNVGVGGVGKPVASSSSSGKTRVKLGVAVAAPPPRCEELNSGTARKSSYKEKTNLKTVVAEKKNVDDASLLFAVASTTASSGGGGDGGGCSEQQQQRPLLETKKERSSEEGETETNSNTNMNSEAEAEAEAETEAKSESKSQSKATDAKNPNLPTALLLAQQLLPPSRLHQGLQVLEREFLIPRPRWDPRWDSTSSASTTNNSHMQTFIQWILNDVAKEEYDLIAAAGVEDLSAFLAGPVAAAAGEWYVNVSWRLLGSEEEEEAEKEEEKEEARLCGAMKKSVVLDA